MQVHLQVIKPASSKLGSAQCQWIIVIEGKGLPAISAADAPPTIATRSLFLRFSLVDRHWLAVAVGTVEFLDCLLRLALARHLDEAKALALTRITIRDHVDRINRAEPAKCILESLLAS